MKKISAKIIADSIDPRGNRITSMILTFPRFILAEAKTHRIISGLHEDVTVTQDLSINSFREGSKNSASSRAIPFDKMVKMVEEDPFIPIAWQKNHKGMQGSEYITDQKIINFKSAVWLKAGNEAIHRAKELNGNLQRARGIFDIEELEDTGVTKQLCNRLLEPFMWHTVLVTATEFDNFYELRCPKYYYEPENKYFKSKKDYSNYWFECFGSGIEEAIEGDPVLWWLNINHSQAEIHIQALAESMWDAMNESIPNQLEAGEWHIPFGNKIYSENGIEEVLYNHTKEGWINAEGHDLELDKIAIQIATARCARLSYMTFDGEIDYEKDIKLHDSLLKSGHASPFEHCCRVLTEEEYENCGKIIPLEDGTTEFQKGWVDNFRGFKSYRRILNFS